MKISTQVLLLCIGLIVRSYYSISKKTASIVDRDFFFLSHVFWRNLH